MVIVFEVLVLVVGWALLLADDDRDGEDTVSLLLFGTGAVVLVATGGSPGLTAAVAVDVVAAGMLWPTSEYGGGASSTTPVFATPASSGLPIFR